MEIKLKWQSFPQCEQSFSSRSVPVIGAHMIKPFKSGALQMEGWLVLIGRDTLGI